MTAQLNKIVLLPVITTRIFFSLSIGILFRLFEISSQVFPENALGCRIRGFLYKPFLKKCGKNFQIGLYAKLEVLKNIEIGNNVYIGHGCWVNGSGGGVKIDDEAMFGPYVTMVGGDHSIQNGSARFSTSGKRGLIHIGKGCWLGAKVTVTSGVTIGAGCVIGANAVVTNNLPDSSCAVGVPAKTIKSFTEPIPIDS